MKYIFPLIIVLVSLFACEQVVELDIPEPERKPVLHGFLKDDIFQMIVTVSWSTPILDSFYKTKIGLNVEVFENGLKKDSLITYLGGYGEDIGVFGVYDINANPLAPISGGEYRIVSHIIDSLDEANNVSIDIRQNMPYPPQIIEGNYEESNRLDERQIRYNDVSVTFQDRPNEDNYYLVRSKIIKKIDSLETYNVYTWTANPLIEEVQNGLGLFFDDKTFDGQLHTLNLRLENQYIHPTDDDIAVYIESISADHYKYLLSNQRFANADGNPFAEPVIVHSNIEGGYGIMTLSSERYLKFE